MKLKKVVLYDGNGNIALWSGWIDEKTRKFYEFDEYFYEVPIRKLEYEMEQKKSLWGKEIFEFKMKLVRKMQEIQEMTDEEFVFWKLKNL